MLSQNLLESARNHADGVVALRRAIHSEPELGLHCPLTMAKVRDALSGLPLTWREGTSTSGAIATLVGGKAGDETKRVLLRGDMDALPMDEKTGLDFASTIAGRMHACGHDTHAAMLTGAARILCERRDELAGTVDFMFQPGEEGHHGARYMIEDGLLEPLPDAAFALHIMPNAPYAVIGGRPGPLMAAADQFTITVAGKGGHASMPHDCADPIPASAAIISALQTMVTRRFKSTSAVVVTVTQVHAGTSHNIVPDEVMIAGTIRTLSAEHRSKAHELLEETANAIASGHGVTAITEIEHGYPVTACDPRAVEIGKKVVAAMGNQTGWNDLEDPIMGAEDFSYVLEKMPGAMFFLGVAKEGDDDWRCACSLHNPHMHVDEGAMPHGVAVLAGCAIEFLENGFDS